MDNPANVLWHLNNPHSMDHSNTHTIVLEWISQSHNSHFRSSRPGRCHYYNHLFRVDRGCILNRSNILCKRRISLNHTPSTLGPSCAWISPFSSRQCLILDHHSHDRHFWYQHALFIPDNNPAS